MRYAVFTMIGPGSLEARRLRTLLGGLFRHEPATPLLVVVDDTGGGLTGLSQFVPGTCEVVRLVNPTKPDHNQLAFNTMLALRYLVTRKDIDFAVKLDTDALVIGPFAGQFHRYFDEHADVGQVGRADIKCDGTPTSYGVYVPFVRRLLRRVQIWRSPSWGVAQAVWGDFAKFRKLVLTAAENGASGGKHCQGGAYAIARRALDRLGESGLLVGDWTTNVCGVEDLLASTLIASTGLKLVSLTKPGEPFGVEAQGLPFSPQELADKGYALIHSVKNDKRFNETDVVRFFESRDGTPSSL